MNKICFDILLSLYKNSYSNQRLLAEECCCSLGNVNKSLALLRDEGLISSDYSLTPNGAKLINESSPENAIILAAGRGMRMVPINLEAPKSLIEINKKPLIEHQIEQLLAAGVKEIHIVVGFLKERFEYLIDKYNVNLIINMQYNEKNNLYSLYKASEFIGNSYIVPGDIFCTENPFRQNEAYSWYMLSDKEGAGSNVTVNKKSEIVKGKGYHNRMVGISYVTKRDSHRLVESLRRMAEASEYGSCFWEEASYCDNKMLQLARIMNDNSYLEINTYEDLRSIDTGSDNLKSDAIEIICRVMDCTQEDIKGIEPLKKGMTNRSFLFSVKDKKYIMRIPGEGTDMLIDRKAEYDVYSAISSKGICDNVIYINPSNGYKISEFIENARVCDSDSDEDLRLCMSKLRNLHELRLKVNHTFDLFKQIDFYENLRGDIDSAYRDYYQTKKNVFNLKEYIDSLKPSYSLTHIDAIPDNFLFYNNDNDICLIDWEYAAMQDPHVDIAMFCIYSFYDKNAIDKLIDIYFDDSCSDLNRIKIYCYVAICGLLWSNWCEYKSTLSIEFGEYSIRQYRYAKDYYKIALSEMDKLKKGEKSNEA